MVLVPFLFCFRTKLPGPFVGKLSFYFSNFYNIYTVFFFFLELFLLCAQHTAMPDTPIESHFIYCMFLKEIIYNSYQNVDVEVHVWSQRWRWTVSPRREETGREGKNISSVTCCLSDNVLSSAIDHASIYKVVCHTALSPYYSYSNLFL